MTNITQYPISDGFRTTLSRAYTGGTGTIYVNATPSGSLPASTTTMVTINPGKSTQQVVIIDGWNSTNNTLNCSSATVEKANGVNYSAQTHGVNSEVIISDNYQFWKNIVTAVSSKVDTNSSDTATGKFANAAARDAYFTSPVNGNSAYLTTEGKRTDYIGGAWADRASGTNPNASTTVAGKVEKATSGEVTAGTATGGTGAELFVGPAEMKSVIDGLTQARAFGNGSDGDVTINSGTTTLSRDMYYNNLTITSPGVLNPNGYRVFVSGTFSGNGTISRNGNNGGSASGGTGGSAGTTLGQGSLNMEKSAGAGANSPGNTSAGIAGSAGTSSNPSMTNISGVAGGSGGSAAFGGGTGGSAGTSTRGPSYNIYGFTYLMHLATAQSLPTALSYGSIASSGGGGSGATNGSVSATGGGGGGAGGNGGFIRIASKIWDFVGIITATGGNGGNGGNGVHSGSGGAGGGGGGGGGNGGIILRIYYKLLNDCTKTLTGGTGGTGGALAGNGSNGSAGTNGNTGETISIQI